jgi:exonuclease I
MDNVEQAKNTWISASQFANLIGASRQAVSKAILSGRIWSSVRYDDSTIRRRYFINVYDGLLEWHHNTDPARPDTKQIDFYKILSHLSP